MSKIHRLERMRYSILTNDLDHCYICGAIKHSIHEIYEGARRIPSMKYGCCLPVCFKCHQRFHSDRDFAIIYKKLFQVEFEKLYSKEKFIEVFKRSYL